MIEFRRVFEVLDGVDYVLIGGAAAVAHGSARFTQDVDLVYRRTSANIERLVSALRPFDPYLRGAPPGLPFVFDAQTVRNGLNFTLTTSIGDLDLLGEVPGMNSYEELAGDAEPVTLFGIVVSCVSLARLIALKRAAGRPKDYEAIAELEALLEEPGV